MGIRPNSLRLDNFKGIRYLKIEFDVLTQLFGDKETGKTTAVDAFLWLLFNKDSQNKKGLFSEDPHTRRKGMHGLDQAVEGVLVTENPLSLAKCLLKSGP